MDNEKIAKMMGHTRWSANDDFSSPEWQQKIRDRVRELCILQEMVLKYVFDPSFEEPHHMILFGEVDSEAWCKLNESAAWLAALEFLYDKEQSNEKA